MSLSTSKSKTQLAYARSGKAVNKPKTKNVQSTQTTKGRHPARNSTGNIYDSIMGQIEPKQQDYIKSLIVKNERESIKHEKEGEKQTPKNENASITPANDPVTRKPVNASKNTEAVTSSSKRIPHKEPQHQAKKQASSLIPSHQRTRSQAELLLLKDPSKTVLIDTSKLIKTEEQKLITEISCHSDFADVYETTSSNNNKHSQQLKPSTSGKEITKPNGQGSSAYHQVEKGADKSNANTYNSNSKNPIIQALNNTSSSFTKKLQAFQLQYPTEQRQQRSTHKKTGSNKLTSGEYFSCQTSPKNGSKNLYTKEVVITTKPTQNYILPVAKNQPISVNISPISSAKNSNQKKSLSSKKALNDHHEPTPTNFISCLDEYLDALTFNTEAHQDHSNSNTQARASTGNNTMMMKRNNSAKMKEFSTSKGHPFTLGKEEQEEETIVLENGNYRKNSAFSNSQKHANPSSQLLPFAQQQKLLNQLQKQRKKVTELNSIIEFFQQQLTKSNKKQNKMKQNQYHMIEVMKELNEQLTEERNQRRRLEGVVKDFEAKIRGISRGKDKKRRESGEDDQLRPERKTIYGTSMMGNSINYTNNPNSTKLEKHSKKLSNNNNNNNNNSRFSSMMVNNNYNQYDNNYPNDDLEYETSNEHYQQKRQSNEDNGFFKNKTQKFSKIISNFELENLPCEEEEEGNFGKGKHSLTKVVRDSMKNFGPQPGSCKNSQSGNFLNSSLPSSKHHPKTTKSRPMTPKLVEQLFRSTKPSKNSSQIQISHHHALLQNNFHSQSQQSDISAQYEHHDTYQKGNNHNRASESSESEFKPTEISEDDEGYEGWGDREGEEEEDNGGYYRHKQQHCEVVKRLR